MRVILLLVVEHSIQKKPRASGKCLSSGLLTTKTDLGTWGGEGPLNRKTRDSERDFAENHKDHYLLLPSLPQSPNSGRCNGCGLWVPFNHALKRGSWLFCDGRLYKYKRGSECFCFGRGKGKKEENLLSVVVFRQYNTIDYTF